MEEMMWVALSSWAHFQPRKLAPRQSPGRLCYPDEATHIFTQYYKSLEFLLSRSNFAMESVMAQMYMTSFSRALAEIPHHEGFVPEAYAERPPGEESDLQDGVDYWETTVGMDRSSPDTGSGAPAPDQAGTMFSPSQEGLYTNTTNWHHNDLVEGKA
jgi:hypothetical protein